MRNEEKVSQEDTKAHWERVGELVKMFMVWEERQCNGPNQELSWFISGTRNEIIRERV